MSSKNQKEDRSDLDNQDQVNTPESSIDNQTDQNQSLITLIQNLHLDDIIDENGDILGFLNRYRIEENLENNPDHKLSCYFCCKTYLASEVTDYTDGGSTLICPYCMVDSVLDGEVPLEKLQKMHESMFSTSSFDEGEYAGEHEGEYEEKIKIDEDELKKILNINVDELDLSVRTQDCLNNTNIKYVGQLVQMSENDLLSTKILGRKSLKEIKELLAYLNLELGMKIDSWINPDQKK